MVKRRTVNLLDHCDKFSVGTEASIYSCSFLLYRKCRLEGEFQSETGKSVTLNYSIMDEHGGINEGVVKPADLLSFARQVAMAMVSHLSLPRVCFRFKHMFCPNEVNNWLNPLSNSGCCRKLLVRMCTT